MTSRIAVLTHYLLIALLYVPCTAGAAETDQLNARGKAILQDKCASCHSIELTGDSPLKDAPPMRTIYRGVAPFIAADLLLLALLALFPAISLWLPHLLANDNHCQ